MEVSEDLLEAIDGLSQPCHPLCTCFFVGCLKNTEAWEL